MPDSKHDVSAILDTFTPEEMALIIASAARIEPKGLGVDLAVIQRVPAMVAKVVSQPQHSQTAFKITAHEKHRKDGYYLVYHPNQAREMVLYWSVAEGEWFTSHKEDQIVRDVGPSDPTFIADAPKEVADGN